MKIQEVKEFKELPDNRNTAKVGDTCIAIWFNEPTWYKFKIEDLEPKYKGDCEMGLGFIDDIVAYDIGLAFHVIVFK